MFKGEDELVKNCIIQIQKSGTNWAKGMDKYDGMKFGVEKINYNNGVHGFKLVNIFNNDIDIRNLNMYSWIYEHNHFKILDKISLKVKIKFPKIKV